MKLFNKNIPYVAPLLLLVVVAFLCVDPSKYSHSLEEADFETNSFEYTAGDRGRIEIAFEYHNDGDIDIFLSRVAHHNIIDHEIEIKVNGDWETFHVPLRTVGTSERIPPGGNIRDTIIVYSSTDTIDWIDQATYRLLLFRYVDSELRDKLETIYSNHFTVR